MLSAALSEIKRCSFNLFGALYAPIGTSTHLIIIYLKIVPIVIFSKMFGEISFGGKKPEKAERAVFIEFILF